MKKHSKKKLKKKLKKQLRKVEKKSLRNQNLADRQSNQAVVELPGLEPAIELVHEVEATPPDGGGVSLDRAKAQWFFGEWHELVQIDMNALSHHPERDRFALLVASAYQQLGDHEKARTYTRLALGWECEPRVVAQVLIAGVHNSLGKLAALKQDQSALDKHFMAAVEAGCSRDTELVAKARSIREMGRIGLLPQAASSLHEAITRIDANEVPAKKQLEIVKGEFEQLKKASEKLNRSLGSTNNLPLTDREIHVDKLIVKHSPLIIVIAGMRHSGSTALFNIIRLAMEQVGYVIECGYSEHIDVDDLCEVDSSIYLIKTHELRDDILEKAAIVITTIRDLRDTVASAVRRKFQLLEKMGVLEYAKYNRSLHDNWKSFAHYQFEYEVFMAQPIDSIAKLLQALGIKDVNIERLYAEVISLPVDRYEETLLSPTHITDPERKLRYWNTLDEVHITTIEKQHAGWLRRNGYMV